MALLADLQSYFPAPQNLSGFQLLLKGFRYEFELLLHFCTVRLDYNLCVAGVLFELSVKSSFLLPSFLLSSSPALQLSAVLRLKYQENCGKRVGRHIT